MILEFLCNAALEMAKDYCNNYSDEDDYDECDDYENESLFDDDSSFDYGFNQHAEYTNNSIGDKIWKKIIEE